MPAGVEIALKLDKRDLAQLDRSLRLLGKNVYDKQVGQAANAAMKLMVSAARRHVPIRHGVLKKSLGTRVKRYRRNRVVYVGMGPQGTKTGVKYFVAHRTGLEYVNPVNYAHLVEFGTRPHSMTRGARLPRVGARAGTAAARGREEGPVVHPGARPQPFMRPAFDQTRHAVLKRYSQRLLRGLDREVRKLAKGA